MDKAKDAARREQVAVGARRQLAEKTWPEVMAIFRYENPRASRKTPEEVGRIKKELSVAGCANMVVFLELTQMEETHRNVAVSYALSLRWRTKPGEAEANVENAFLYFACPDILAGTRNGVEGAMDWLSTVCEAFKESVPESVQVMDKIFGEAVEILNGGSTRLTIGDMLQVVTDETSPLKPSTPSKH